MDKRGGSGMTASERGLGKRWFDLVWNQSRREAIGEMLPSDAVLHEGGVDTFGAEGFYAFFDRINAAFSGLHIDVEDSIAEDDKLCVRWSCRAMHTGGGLGFDPTGA